MLTTDRLILRLPTMDDAEVLLAINESNWPVVGNRQRTLDETRAQVADNAGRPFGTPGWHQYVVERRDRAGVIGRIAINFDGPGERQAELGYGFLPAGCGQGMATEAVGRTLSHLFDDHARHRVIAMTGIDNGPPRRLLDRLSFRIEAETVESFFHHAEQRFVDEAVYAILAREWAAR
jgi:RimJ/RimL family protein N-acetyltransferase